ncbi:hypothetical protein GCM10022217_12380 [Chryseobacterium ginsenosidimutans]
MYCELDRIILDSFLDEDGSYVTVIGEITLKATNGTYNYYDYCDVWRFENGKIAELKAFVIEKKS